MEKPNWRPSDEYAEAKKAHRPWCNDCGFVAYVGLQCTICCGTLCSSCWMRNHSAPKGPHTRGFEQISEDEWLEIQRRRNNEPAEEL